MSDIQKGILQVLGEDGPAPNIFVEYLDARHIDIKRIQEKLADFLGLKYRSVKFDVIIACDDAAIEFVRRFRGRLFPGVPVAFCGLSYPDGGVLENSRDFVGVTEEIAFIETMELALSLHKQAKHIYVFSDDISAYVPSTPPTLTRMARIEQRVSVEVIEGLKIDQAVAKMSQFPADSLIILIDIGKDADGRHIPCQKAARLLSRARPIPIYACWDFYLGHGVVGGKMVNGYSQGQAAGRIALQMLKGALPPRTPRVRRGPAAFMFDQARMARFNLLPSMLPRHSRIINRPSSFYERYKKLLQVSLGSSIVLFLTAILLTLSLVKTRKIQKSLKESEEKAKALLYAMPDAMFCIDKKGVFKESTADPEDLELHKLDIRVGLNLTETLPLPFARKVMKYISLTLFENQMQTFEYDVEIPGKGRRSHEARMVPSGSDEVMTIVRDMTEKKEAAEQVRQSEQKLHRLIQSLQIGIVVHGPDTRVLDFNIAALELLGLTPHQFYGEKSRRSRLAFCPGRRRRDEKEPISGEPGASNRQKPEKRDPRHCPSGSERARLGHDQRRAQL